MAAEPKLGANRGNAGKGRPKGSANKSTTAVKEALGLAFEGMGGAKQLQAWAKANQTEFYKLWVKMLPQDINANVDAKVANRIELVGVRPGDNSPA